MLHHLQDENKSNSFFDKNQAFFFLWISVGSSRSMNTYVAGTCSCVTKDYE